MVDRLSILRAPLNRATMDSSPGGVQITPSELKDLKKLAVGGTIPLVDINRLTEEVAGMEDGPVKSEQAAALAELQPLAARAAQAQSDGIMTSLEVLDTINPFAWVRWGFGGTKPGCGLW